MQRIDFDQLTFHAQSAWDQWYAFSDRACHATATAWEWYCNTFFSTKAMERYKSIGDGLGLMMICAVSLGMAARVTWDEWVETEEAQQMSQAIYKAVDQITAYSLDKLAEPESEAIDEITDDDLWVELLVDNTDWLADETIIDDDLAMASLSEHLESEELPELLLIAQEVGAEVAVQDKSGLITSIWRAL